MMHMEDLRHTNMFALLAISSLQAGISVRDGGLVFVLRSLKHHLNISFSAAKPG